MSWPFERANSLGYAMFENFTSADATKIDMNAAAAASGEIWSDLTAVRNLFPPETATVGSDIISEAPLLWEPTTGRWFSFGHTSANIGTAYQSLEGSTWNNTSLASDVTVTNFTLAKSVATDGNGYILLGGAANNANKCRGSSNGGNSWVLLATNHNSTERPDTICWMPSAGIFVVGFDNTSTTNLETYDPNTLTFTTRTAPNSHARGAAAASATRVVIISSASTNKCITSEDGVTWTERTLPATKVWNVIAYSADIGLFMIVANDGTVATSSDGITWSTSGTTSPQHVSSPMFLYAIGRIWVYASGNYVQASVDSGATWTNLANFSMSASIQMGASERQVMFATGSSGETFRRSIATG